MHRTDRSGSSPFSRSPGCPSRTSSGEGPAAAPPDDQRIRLSSDRIEVALMPGKRRGHLFVHRSRVGPGHLVPDAVGLARRGSSGAQNSQRAWLPRYPGGWQQLPNAGPAREQDDAVLGTTANPRRCPGRSGKSHGRAGPAGRGVADRSAATGADRHGDRFFLPGPRCVYISRPTRWPCAGFSIRVFGSPFVDGDTLVDTSAGLFFSDRDTPGTGILPDTLTRFPILPGIDGDADLRAMPGPTRGARCSATSAMSERIRASA